MVYIFVSMNLSELTEKVTSLSHEERVSLVTILLGTLDPPVYHVSSEEVTRRREDGSTTVTLEKIKSSLGK